MNGSRSLPPVAPEDPGRGAPPFIGTTCATLPEVLKTPAHWGTPAQLLIVYEAGPLRFWLGAAASQQGLLIQGCRAIEDPTQTRGDAIESHRMPNNQYPDALLVRIPSRHLTRGGHIRTCS
jgi:hypothetical protein